MCCVAWAELVMDLVTCTIGLWVLHGTMCPVSEVCSAPLGRTIYGIGKRVHLVEFHRACALLWQGDCYPMCWSVGKLGLTPQGQHNIVGMAQNVIQLQKHVRRALGLVKLP